MITYENEDEEYILWLRKNDAGFVLNENQQRSGDPPFTLHTTRCGHLWEPDLTKEHTLNKKLCSQSKQELVAWAERTKNKFKECPDCKP